MARQLAGASTDPRLPHRAGAVGSCRPARQTRIRSRPRLRNSRAEVVVDDFMTMDVQRLGTFDVVLFLGVIYHLEEPLRALRRLRQVTRGVAAIESEAVVLRGRRGPLWQFVDAAQMHDDPTIWWVPTAEGLRAMCFAAGFSSAEIVAGPPKRSRFRRGRAVNYRGVVHAFC